MTPDFKTLVTRVIHREGGFRLWADPNDPGGRTLAGLSRVWTDNPRCKHGVELWDAVDEAMNEDPPSIRLSDYREPWDGSFLPPKVNVLLRDCYRANYWDTRWFPMPVMPDYFCVKETMFDAAIHRGPSYPAIWAQNLVGEKADGLIGDDTRKAIVRYVDEHGPAKFALQITNMRIASYETDGSGYMKAFIKRAHQVLSQALDADRVPSP